MARQYARQARASGENAGMKHAVAEMQAGAIRAVRQTVAVRISRWQRQRQAAAKVAAKGVRGAAAAATTRVQATAGVGVVWW